MITNDNENWHYLWVKSISTLLKGITSNHVGDFYCLICLHSYRTKEKLKKCEKVCKDHNYGHVKIPNEDKKILKYNSGEKSLKAPFTIYADLERILEKISTCQNDPKKSSTEKKAEYMPSGYSLVTCYSFDTSKNKWVHYRGKNCMEMFCKDLKIQAIKIINYEKKEIIPLTNEETESFEKQKVYSICKKEFSNDKKYRKVRYHCHYTGKLEEPLIITAI